MRNLFSGKGKERGFTLMELMVVMGILAVLAGIVVPGVTGTKDVSGTTQSKSDRQGVQSAAANFNNASTTAAYPEASADYAVAASASGGIPLYAANGTSSIAAAGATATGYRLMDFTKATNTRDSTGNVISKTFVPDFLDRAPSSEAAMSGGVNVYRWMLKQGTSDAEGQTRTVWVFKLNDAGDKYILEP